MKTLVLGVGVSGIAAARLARSSGAEVVFYDDRPDAALPRDLEGCSLVSGEWNQGVLDEVERVIASPGFPPSAAPITDALAHSIPTTTEIGYALDRVTQPYVAVTGTNGKTTVTEMITAMLVGSGVDAVSIGNIGTPASELVGSAHEMFVVELSSFQLHWWQPTPQAAVLVNLAPDHLDWHGGFDGYREAKARVFTDLAPNGTVAFDIDDPGAAQLFDATHVPAVPCSGTRVPAGGNGFESGHLSVSGQRFPCASEDPTHRVNLTLAATAALQCGAAPESVAHVIDTYQPGPNRRHIAGIVDGVTWVNDSKATNPHAALAACRSYRNIRLLAGGRNKDLDLAPIGGAPNVEHIYAFGESGPDIAASARAASSVHRTMLDAVAASRADAVPGDTVLLSPGCTSFDEFTSYAERGKVFEEAVHAMGGGDVV